MLRKIGRWLLCITPFLMMLAVQVVVAFAYSLVYIILTGNMLEDLMSVIALSHLATALVGILWYSLAYGRKQPRSPIQVFSIKTVAAIILLAVALQALIQLLFIVLDKLAPSWIEAYNALMEQSGIGDMTVLSTIATLILAPIGEELAFRGLTYRYLRRAGAGIIVANIIQALLFGIMHMQPLQTAYAAVLGLVLGYLCEKYHSVYVPIVMHCLFNFVGTYGISLFEDVEDMRLIGILFFVVGSIFLAAGIVLVKTDRKSAVNIIEQNRGIT